MFEGLKLSGWVVAADVAALVLFIGTSVPATLQFDEQALAFMLPLMALIAMAAWAHAWISFSKVSPRPAQRTGEDHHITISISNDDMHLQEATEGRAGGRKHPSVSSRRLPEDDMTMIMDRQWLSSTSAHTYRRNHQART